MAGSTAYPTAADFQRELDALERRLRDGEQRIEEARHLGADIAAWEAFWIELLHTYEAIHDQLDAATTPGDRMAA